ncbi:LPS biosynthesis RfbU related protein [Nitrospira sp. KM1]|uniref:glycosyltransferase family 4 protein n=1 Tax=Nitrospira sp. KM1 TaxID=1936990 RepID=UPI0013A7AF94|nr:glycosyltransferase family 4 protein [Nitrospira sp. KM1]BCA54116.1 LPS biosynthesis RfbU related protein [Nitrospira sp. KM1]
MNILIVTPFFTPQTGGVATYIEDLRRFLGRRGHHVIVLRAGESDSIVNCHQVHDEHVFELYMRGIWIPEAPLKGLLASMLYFIPTMFRLARFLQKQKIQLVCLEYPLPFMWYFSILKRVMNLKLLVGLHGDDVLSLHVLSGLDQKIVRQVIRDGDQVLAHSSSLLRQAEQILGELPPNRGYLPYGVECERIRTQASKAPTADVTSLRPYVLTVAKLYDRKGIDVLLEAVRILREELQGHRFVIAGDGPEETKLKSMSRHLGVDDHVVFLGDVSSKDIPALFRHCELFVLPSRSEPFGIVLLEAMTFEKAIVATRVGGIPEFVTDGQTGVLVEPCNSVALADTIRRVLRDPELQSRLAKNGLSTVETEYDYNRLVLRYEGVFKDLLEAA